MNDIDELDEMWRTGLAGAAHDVVSTVNPQARVAARVKHRRRSRWARTASVAVLLLAAALGTATHLGGHAQHVRVAAEQPSIIQVTDAPAGTLQILFPGRLTAGNPPRVLLPSGVVRFEIRGLTAGHRLVIDGAPGFVANFQTPSTITKEVQLDPGEYLMHCTIPGHAEAGEEAILDVTSLTRADLIARVQNERPGASVTAKFMLFTELQAVDGGVVDPRLLSANTPIWVVEAIGGRAIDTTSRLNWIVEVYDARTGDMLASAGSTKTARPTWWVGLPDNAPS
jgi:hypothetical protein